MKDRPIIKFSHNYQKLLDSDNDVITEAKLLHVIEVDMQSLNLSFIDYDTDNGKYKLPKSGKYIMLIFEKPRENNWAWEIDSKDLFTTLRRHTKQKFEYYNNLIGQTFEVKSPNSE